jgi:hypothetical protein
VIRSLVNAFLGMFRKPEPQPIKASPLWPSDERWNRYYSSLHGAERNWAGIQAESDRDQQSRMLREAALMQNAHPGCVCYDNAGDNTGCPEHPQEGR